MADAQKSRTDVLGEFIEKRVRSALSDYFKDVDLATDKAAPGAGAGAKDEKKAPAGSDDGLEALADLLDIPK